MLAPFLSLGTEISPAARWYVLVKMTRRSWRLVTLPRERARRVALEMNGGMGTV